MAPSNSSANVVYAIFLIYFDDFAYDCFIIPIAIKQLYVVDILLLPPATKLGQGYVFTGFCDSVHSGGVPDQVHPQVHPPIPSTPPRPETPPRTRYTPPPRPGIHPGTRYTPLVPGTPPRTRYNPPDKVHPPGIRYTPHDQVHPPGPGTPPQTRYTPPDQVHSLGTRYTPRDQVHPPWTRYPPDQVHPPRPGTPPQTRYTTPPPGPGRYGLRAGGTHPTGMHSCLINYL